MLAPNPCSFHKSFMFFQTKLPSFLCSDYPHLFFTQRPHTLFPACILCPLLAVVISLYLWGSIFKLQVFLSKPLRVSRLCQAVTSSVMHFSFHWDMCCITTAALSLNSAFSSINFSQYPLPISPLWISDKAIFTDVCSVCFSTQQRPSLSYFFHLTHPLLLPSLSPTSSCFHCCNLKFIACIFPIFTPKDLRIFLVSAHYFLSLSFPSEILLAGCMVFSLS